MVGSRMEFHIGFASDLGISPAPSLAPAVLPRVDQMCVCTPVGRLPWIASSRPRGHCSAMPSGQASGRRVSPFFPFYLTLYSSPWPWSLTIWSRPMSQAHRACSVMLLMTLVILWFRFSVAKHDSVNCDGALHVMPCLLLCSLPLTWVSDHVGPFQ
jgi:hypothetical protein